MGFFDFLGNIFGGKDQSQKVPCPSCEEIIAIDTERCPKCGISIFSMFRRKCPKCGELNDIGSGKCVKCGNGFYAGRIGKGEIAYRCYVCGYDNDSFFAVCPVCGTRSA